ncbi:hypothetical protein FOA43_001731 [Brettanomyces nanus]|uniref:ATP-dependent RNA helicase n=1 Tax=Eeniella nana TaxID=13502 RepID=A0A875S0I0_EENNA|nr:uncharacterized protein FOA43_001731 [Brettanomyces nanus]QPG74403.1 hypothetical protein FOA43_001731 [Brettanomyces nanus]
MSSTNWDDLSYKIQPWIKDAMLSLGFSHMTPVQASTIPLLSQNKDVVVQAVTGSGKTMAFVIPVLEKICRIFLDEPFKKSHFGALVVSPTRELAKQIEAVFNSVLEYQPERSALPQIKTQLLVGSIQSLQEDLYTFISKRPQILVGTPGRINEFLRSSSVKTNSCEILILDEADKLLDMSFLSSIESIVRFLPRQRRTGLFSATVSSAGNDIFKTGMTNPVKITVNSSSLPGADSTVPTSLGLCYMVLQANMKLKVLLQLLTKYRYHKTIVYFPTCISVTYFYGIFHHLFCKMLQEKRIDDEIALFSLHGKLEAKPRMKTLSKFTESTEEKSVLFTTDVAARGLDIPDVDLVIQVDPPTDPDMFLHRCGRTGRANKVGKAVTMLNKGREEDYVGFMDVKGITLEQMSVPKIELEFSEWYDSSFRQWELEDRGRYDHAVRSYVAYVMYYSKHVASSIFRIRTLDYKGLASMYGLTRLPKMPENKYVEDFPEGGFLDSSINFDKYSYLDKSKEETRLYELKTQERKKERRAKTMKKKFLDEKNTSWSDKSLKKGTKVERRVKMKRRREAVEIAIAQKEEEGDSNEAEDREKEKDWKEAVIESKRRKKSKKQEMVQGSFDDL